MNNRQDRYSRPSRQDPFKSGRLFAARRGCATLWIDSGALTLRTPQAAPGPYASADESPPERPPAACRLLPQPAGGQDLLSLLPGLSPTVCVSFLRSWRITPGRPGFGVVSHMHSSGRSKLDGQDDIAKVLAAAPIVAVVGEFVKLRPAGRALAASSPAASCARLLLPARPRRFASAVPGLPAALASDLA